jgi:hypothetical protein
VKWNIDLSRKLNIYYAYLDPQVLCDGKKGVKFFLCHIHFSLKEI